VQADDTQHLYHLVLDTLESRPPPSHPRLLSDVLSLLQLSVHGMSKTELLHVLCIPRSLFEAFFGGYESVLFVQVSSEAVRPEGSRRVTLASSELRRVVRERYLSTDGLTRGARMRLIEHFEGFIGPGTLEGLPTLEEIITCGKDGDFARSSHELAWALVREEAWDYVGQLIGNLAVFRTLWSSDVRRDVYLMWVTLQKHVDPVEVYWDPLIDLYWTTTDAAGNQDLTRTLPLARLAADCGELLLLLGNPQAARLISLSVELHKKLHGTDQHPDVARCHAMLGHLHRSSGRPGATLEAIAAYESSYNIYARTVGNSVPAVASLVSLGETLITQGALNEALEALRLAKKMLEDLGISDFHPQSARCFNNMGLVAKRTGQLSAAEAYYNRALAIRVEAHGEDHPHTALTLRNLGSLAVTMQQRERAIGHFSRALGIAQRVHGPMHTTTASTHEWLGGVLQEMGNETEGKVHAATAAFIRERGRELAEQARGNAAGGSTQQLEASSSNSNSEKEVNLPRPGRDAGAVRPGDTIQGAVVDI
jgi:tetratricopeptide (TPR) repeat protein